jgi:hypothetical protein
VKQGDGRDVTPGKAAALHPARQRGYHRGGPGENTHGTTHYDLCDKPEPVGLALEKLVPFSWKHLGANGVREAERAGTATGE